MTANIISFVARKLGRSDLKPAAKVALGLDRPRILRMGMKVPRGEHDTVELCIISDEAGKKRRILSRVTVYVEDLRRLVREVDEERHFHPQAWIEDITGTVGEEHGTGRRTGEDQSGGTGNGGRA
jgi:hypothetical protein